MPIESPILAAFNAVYFLSLPYCNRFYQYAPQQWHYLVTIQNEIILVFYSYDFYSKNLAKNCSKIKSIVLFHLSKSEHKRPAIYRVSPAILL